MWGGGGFIANTLEFQLSEYVWRVSVAYKKGDLGPSHPKRILNNNIIRSYRDVIVVLVTTLQQGEPMKHRV